MEELQNAIRWNVSIGDIAQWVTLVAGAWWFLHKQTRAEATRIAHLDDFQSSVLKRIEDLESLAYSRNSNGFVTLDEYRAELAKCGDKHSSELVLAKERAEMRLKRLEEVFESVSRRLTEMDKSREKTRETDQVRLANIEQTLAGLASDVGHISRLVPTLEKLVSKLGG